MPFTCRISDARRIGLPWPQVMPLRSSMKSKCASRWTMWIGFVREGSDSRHRDRVVTAQDIRHGLGIEQGAHGLLGVGKAALCVGVDHVAVAGIDDLHFSRGQIGDFVLEIEHALRSKP